MNPNQNEPCVNDDCPHPAIVFMEPIISGRETVLYRAAYCRRCATTELAKQKQTLRRPSTLNSPWHNNDFGRGAL